MAGDSAKQAARVDSKATVVTDPEFVPYNGNDYEFIEDPHLGENQHRAVLHSVPYFSTGTIWIATCTCGEYRTDGKCTSEREAVRQWTDHSKAKHGAV